MRFYGDFILCVCGVKIGLMNYLLSHREEKFLKIRKYLTYPNSCYKAEMGLIKCCCCDRQIGEMKEYSNTLILIPVKYVKQVKCGIYIDMRGELDYIKFDDDAANDYNDEKRDIDRVFKTSSLFQSAHPHQKDSVSCNISHQLTQ